MGETAVDGSLPNLRRQIAGLLDGMIDLHQFQRWFAQAETAIELRGTDAELDLMDRVLLLLAEYSGDHISAAELLDELRIAAADFDRTEGASHEAGVVVLRR
jgi:hypothetical protein